MEEAVDLWKGIILPFTNFFIFIALAIYFFRKPARAAAQKRRANFEKVMAEARAAREEALAKLADLQKREQGLEQELTDIRRSSLSVAHQESAKIVDDAERFAAHLRQEAGRIAEAELSKARATLRLEIVEAVRDAVATKLKQDLDAKAHLSIVRGKIDALQHIRAET